MRVYTSKEVAKSSGLSYSTVYDWRAKGILPAPDVIAPHETFFTEERFNVVVGAVKAMHNYQTLADKQSTKNTNTNGSN